jgi:hypothetical protein
VSSRPRALARRARDAARRRRAGGAAANPAAANGGGNGSARLLPEERLWEVEERYRGSFPLPALAYGTVRDWTESVDTMPGLARASFDLKNLQRCWMVKAVLGNVQKGGRLVEIGAGEPLVAGLLSRLGYQVTVVDPYDGSGNGPREYEAFRQSYPDVSFIRDRFPPVEGLGGEVAAVYSISVLEHVPLDAIRGVIAGARAALSGGGCSIHAIDHVVAGWGSEEHLARLQQIVEESGLDAAELEQLIERLNADPETYFVSAEAHNRWRGAIPYDDYPMRRIASVNLFTRA